MMYIGMESGNWKATVLFKIGCYSTVMEWRVSRRSDPYPSGIKKWPKPLN